MHWEEPVEMSDSLVARISSRDTDDTKVSSLAA